MDKLILKQSLEVIKQRNKEALKKATSFLQNALENNEFKEIYQQIKQAEIENAKCEAFDMPPKHDLDKLNKKKTEIIKKLDIDEKLLTPTFFCKKCNDTGYANSKMCDCLKEIVNDNLIKKSGLCHNLSRFEDCDYNLFDEPEKIKKLYNTLKLWCNEENKYNIVLLCGKTGVGKTHVMECMAKRLIDNNNIVYWTSAFNLNQSLLKFHTTFDNTKLDHVSTLLETEYLFVDDLGTEPILKNVTVEGLYNILSDRIEHNKKTIISTNLNLRQIEDTYGERIFSRLVNRCNCLCLNIENCDLRLKNRK